MIESITPKTLKTWLENGEAVLIDVRGRSENAKEAIDGAHLLIPLDEFGIDKIEGLIAKKIVVHCRSGVRSEMAARKIPEAFPNAKVYNLEGGILAWVKAGYPVKKSKPAFYDRVVSILNAFTSGLS